MALWLTLLLRIPLFCKIIKIYRYVIEHAYFFHTASFIQGVAHLLLFLVQFSKTNVLGFKDEPEEFSPAICLMELLWGFLSTGICTAVCPLPVGPPRSRSSSNGGFSVCYGKGVYTTRSTGNVIVALFR